MRNASGKMRNDQCGTNVIGRFENHVTMSIPQITTPLEIAPYG